MREILGFTLTNDTLNADVTPTLGLFMGTTEGIAAAAVPEPGVSGDNPGWMWRAQYPIRGGAENVLESVRVDVDLRAMRKFGAADRDVAPVMDVGSGAGVRITGLFRLLIKLP